jgi:hypothetical protein
MPEPDPEQGENRREKKNMVHPIVDRPIFKHEFG